MRDDARYCASALLCCCLSVGQMSTLPAAQAIADLPGPPKNPTIFSQMTAIWQGALQYRNTVDVKGPVVSVEREEIQSPNQNPSPYHTTAAMKFDDDGHLVKSTCEDSLRVSTTINVWENGNLQSHNVTHHPKDAKSSDGNEWQRWTYDRDGRLSEFKAGRDKEATNDYVNFKYDPKGRPLGYELYAQILTEISYAGNKITLSRLRKYQRHKFFEQVQTVDDKGRVVDLRVSDGYPLKPWYHVTFKYDEKGRVVEQFTDPFKLGSGDDDSPIPGRLVVNYDDEKHSGEQRFYDTDGKLALQTTFTFDRDGILTKLCVLDASGKEQTGSEIFVDAQHKSSIRAGNVEWEIIYDDHGNWTERRRWFTPADGTPRIMTRVIRQTITYR
jgi:hypothetical protein